MTDAPAPHTADGDAFRFRAGRPSLDLCSTLLWRYRAPTEQLRTPSDLRRWLAQAGLRPVPRTVREEDLQATLQLREAIYALVHDRLRARRLSPARLATVNAVAAHPDPIPRMTTHGQVVWSADEPPAAALSRVARDAIALLAGPLAGRLRECAAPDCAFLFLDTSRAGQRRWCAMDRCGNRQHVREHRRRRQDTLAPSHEH